MVEVQKVEFFRDVWSARATLCGDRRGRGAKTRVFFAFLRRTDEPSARIGVVEVQKLKVFACFAVPARPSAVEVQKLELFFLRFCGARLGPLRGSCVSTCSHCGAVRIRLSLGEPILLLAKWPFEVVSWFARLLSQSRGRGFESPLVRGSSSWKIATFKYESSRRSTLSQLRLLSTKVARKVNFRSSGATFEREVHFRSSGRKIATFKCESCTRSLAGKSQLLSTKVARDVSFRSSGWKTATPKYESSTRSKLSLLRRLEYRNF